MSSDYKQLFDQIRVASGTLNAAANAATEQIEAVEKRLLDSEPGVAVWCAPFLEEESDFENEEDEDEVPLRARRVAALGFAKQKKWGILVREQFFSLDGAAPLGERTTLLRKADRDLRVQALPHLSAVLEAVRDALTLRVDRLKAGTKEERASDEARSN